MPATACCSLSRSLPGPWPGHYNCVQFVIFVHLLYDNFTLYILCYWPLGSIKDSRFLILYGRYKSTSTSG